MNKIKSILQDVYQVNLTTKEHIPITNNIIDESLISSSKRTVLSFGMNYLKDDFVNIKKSYPEDNMIEVDFNLDFVVLKGEDYRKLIKLIDKHE